MKPPNGLTLGAAHRGIHLRWILARGDTLADLLSRRDIGKLDNFYTRLAEEAPPESWVCQRRCKTQTAMPKAERYAVKGNYSTARQEDEDPPSKTSGKRDA